MNPKEKYMTKTKLKKISEAVASALMKGFLTILETSGKIATNWETFEKKAKSHKLRKWKRKKNFQATSVGVGTGILGGPAILLEGVDIAALLRICAKGCFGIGYILDGEVNPDEDLHSIVLVWAGVATASKTASTAGKITFKGGIKVKAKAAVIIAETVHTPVILSAKFGSKKVAAFAGKKAGSKFLATGSKLIPVIGGIVSGGVNLWITNGLLNAAEEFYRTPYFTIEENIVD